MRTGIIVYAIGEPPQDWTEGSEHDVRALLPDADKVEIITAKTGHFDIHDAWYKMVSGGAARVLCKMATFNEAGQIQFTGRELRLCGYS